MAERHWSPGARLAAILCLAIAAVQIAIPARAFFEPRPVRFGWHMYSSLTYLPEAWVEQADGSISRVDVGQMVGDPRAEIHWSEPLAEVLCGSPEARAVIVTDRDGEERVPCR